ncbi:MAG: hypothetical protein ABJA11_05565 [Pseudolysinimonas sp.]
MRVGVPRWVIVGLAALFSAYVVVLGVYTIDIPRTPYPAIAGMVLFAIVIAVALWPVGRPQMPIWMAAFAIASEVAITLMVSAEIDLHRPGGPSYATWYIAGVGIISTIVCTRGRPIWAWVGIVFLVIQTVLWAGPMGLLGLGVIGSASWVTVAAVIRSALTRAARDARRFTLAEREATTWHAAQEAHVMERQFRLGQTSEMAARMLGTIQLRKGDLSPIEREESLNIEGAIRDEIRGRKLLNDAVRDEVMDARRRGTTITLLDEGGIDDLDDADLDRVLGELANAIRGTTADRVIARTVPEGSDVAVTVVGLNRPDEHARALGIDSGDDEEDVALWLEIPRAIHEPSR